MTEKVLVAWSGGKDSAMALHALLGMPEYNAAALLTTITEEYNRISMHGVRTELLIQQAEALGLPVEQVTITPRATDDEYEQKMLHVLTAYQQKGVSSVVFGDLFLQDIRAYRERNLNRIGVKALFPLWQQNTTHLAREFISLGFKAIISCVDGQALSQHFAGRIYDNRFLDDLPPGIDPCGENGEFHSFVFDGPIFRNPIAFTKGEVVLRDNRFYFCDLVPPGDGAGSEPEGRSFEKSVMVIE